jgi:hypothetical protein
LSFATAFLKEIRERGLQGAREFLKDYGGDEVLELFNRWEKLF